MLYVASLYSLNAKTSSEEDVNCRKRRYEYTLKRVSDLLCAGEMVFSPIAHCHELATRYELPKDFGFFKKLDHNFIDIMDGVLVLMMSDDKGSWVNSEGMQDEIRYAQETGKPVKFITCEDYKNFEVKFD